MTTTHTKTLMVWMSLFFMTGIASMAQEPIVTEKGDTINRFNAKGLRQGPWLIQVEPLRGQPGYEEEGVFLEGKKEGTWRRFSLQGDLIAVENYKGGFRDGKQMYFTRLGEPLREESWKAVDPTNPYDTIEVPDLDNPLISHTKVVRLESDEVRHGTWTYFDSMTGAVVRRETFISGQKLTMPDGRSPIPAASGTSSQGAANAEKAKPKPKAVEEWEKKNNGKKRVTVRDGSTGGG